MLGKPSFLVSMAGFKGTLTNREATDAVCTSLNSLQFPNRGLPIADGGRGSLECVRTALGGEKEAYASFDPLGRDVSTEVLLYPNRQAPSFAYVESPDTCGHHLISISERDPMRASSRGLGVVLRTLGARHGTTLRQVYVGLGDSAISDAGLGMLAGLGFEFTDHGGNRVPPDAHGLRQIAQVKPPASTGLDKVKLLVLCDVLNSLTGPRGSARVFAPQKGATPEQVLLIEQGIENFAQLIAKTTGRQINEEPMTGSCGGLAAGFRGFLGAELVQGARYLLDWIQFDETAKQYDFLITGEGKTDQQTLSGKAPAVAIERMKALNKKSIIISGTLGTGYESLIRDGAVLEAYECGQNPSAREALISQCDRIFRDRIQFGD